MSSATMNNLAFISNLAGPDGFLICFFVLIFFGAKRLPELARSMGGAVREFNKAKEEFTSQLTSPPAAQPLAAPRQELMPVTPPVPVDKASEPLAAAEPATTPATHAESNATPLAG